MHVYASRRISSRRDRFNFIFFCECGSILSSSFFSFLQHLFYWQDLPPGGAFNGNFTHLMLSIGAPFIDRGNYCTLSVPCSKPFGCVMWLTALVVYHVPHGNWNRRNSNTMPKYSYLNWNRVPFWSDFIHSISPDILSDRSFSLDWVPQTCWFLYCCGCIHFGLFDCGSHFLMVKGSKKN